MILYHGSNMAIDKPDLSKSKPYKDFGRGFYLSADLHQAQRMAEQRTTIMKSGSPTITRFSFDEAAMRDGSMKTKIFDSYTEEWAEFVWVNRDIHMPQPSHDYDFVYGPIADDSVTFQLRRYKYGTITLQEFVRELQYPYGITFQYYFGSDLALSKLTRL